MEKNHQSFNCLFQFAIVAVVCFFQLSCGQYYGYNSPRVDQILKDPRVQQIIKDPVGAAKKSANAGIPETGPILTRIPVGGYNSVPAIQTEYGKTIFQLL